MKNLKYLFLLLAFISVSAFSQTYVDSKNFKVNSTGIYSGKKSYTAKTSNYPVTADDNFIDCTSGTFTVTLPAAATAGAGKEYVIKNSGTGVITVVVSGGGLIDAVTSKILSMQYATIVVTSDGTNWKIRNAYSIPPCPHASVSSNVTQSAIATNVSYPLLFENNDALSGIYRCGGTFSGALASPTTLTCVAPTTTSLCRGTPIRFSALSDVTKGVALATTYYATNIASDNTTFQLSSTIALARAGTADINLSAVVTGTFYCISRLYMPETGSYLLSLSALIDATNAVASIMDVWFVRGTTNAVTITNANPGVVTLANHGMIAGDEFTFSSTGSCSGITMGNRYYVIATDLSANTFKFSATSGGLGVNTTGTQTGTLSIYSYSGVPIANTNTQNKIKDTDIQIPVAVPLILPALPGDFYRLDYHADQSTIRWLAVAAQTGPPVVPACPSVILTVDKISR